MRQKPKTHYLKDIWEWYALKMLAANPTWCGVYKDKIQNYYIYAKFVNSDNKKRVEEVMSYKKFKLIVTSMFEMAKDRIIQGEALQLSNSLGVIFAKRVDRDHSKKVINYAKTKLYPKVWSEEKQRMVRSKIVYFTNDDWCRIGWRKLNKALRNLGVYEFDPTTGDSKGKKGFKQMFAEALKKNPSLKFKYPHYPLYNNTKTK
jgi:hypothetical protein